MNPSCWWPTLRVIWRNGSEPYAESYGLHLEGVRFSRIYTLFWVCKGKVTPLKYKFWAINDRILLSLCAVWLQVSLGSTSRKQCCMKPSLAISDWSLCLLNNACVSFESTGSKKRAFSEPPGRRTMSESCRMHLTVARSQCLTGDALGGEFLSPQVARLKTALGGILHVFSLTVPRMSTQWHRCWSCTYGSCPSP